MSFRNVARYVLKYSIRGEMLIIVVWCSKVVWVNVVVLTCLATTSEPRRMYYSVFCK